MFFHQFKYSKIVLYWKNKHSLNLTTTYEDECCIGGWFGIACRATTRSSIWLSHFRCNHQEGYSICLSPIYSCLILIIETIGCWACESIVGQSKQLSSKILNYIKYREILYSLLCIYIYIYLYNRLELMQFHFIW